MQKKTLMEVCLPAPPPHFKLGVHNRLNQLCFICSQLCSIYSQLCSMVLQLLSIVLVPFPRIFFLKGGLRILDSKQRESILLQLRSNCAQSCCNFFNCTDPFFQLPGGGSRNSDPPPIANLGFETIGINYSSIVFNCAAIFCDCTHPFFQLPGGWFSKLRPTIANFGFKTTEINLQLCSTVLQFLSLVPAPFFTTQSPEVECCGIVLTFLFENCGLVFWDTKLVSAENSSRSQNLQIRSLELKESIVCLLFDAEVCWRTLQLCYLPQWYCSSRKQARVLKIEIY